MFIIHTLFGKKSEIDMFFSNFPNYLSILINVEEKNVTKLWAISFLQKTELFLALYLIAVSY